MKNHCFLILAHKQPDLLRRILSVLAAPNHYFVINVDSKYKNIQEFRNKLCGIANVTIVSYSVFHCDFSHLEALLAMFKKAIAIGNIDYYHVISGQDYPLRSNEQFDSFFESTDHSFMWIDRETPQIRKDRDYFQNAWHFNKLNKYSSKVYHGFKVGIILGYILRRKSIPGYSGGWDWFSWHSSVVDYFFSYLEEHPNYVKRYNYTMTPTEHIFHTVVAEKLKELRIESDNPLRYVSWNPKREVSTTYRPYNLNELDYPFVINSKAFFCRKVDEKESNKLLDMIDAQRNEPYNINDHDYFI